MKGTTVGCSDLINFQICCLGSYFMRSGGLRHSSESKGMCKDEVPKFSPQHYSKLERSSASHSASCISIAK